MNWKSPSCPSGQTTWLPSVYGVILSPWWWWLWWWWWWWWWWCRGAETCWSRQSHLIGELIKNTNYTNYSPPLYWGHSATGNTLCITPLLEQQIWFLFIITNCNIPYSADPAEILMRGRISIKIATLTPGSKKQGTVSYCTVLYY